jgi:hypothetical protein
LASALPAQAELSSPVGVTAIVPGGYTGDANDGFTLSDTLPVADLATGISTGDSSNIGSSLMLLGEFVRFKGNSIEAHVAAGGVDAGGGLITGLFGDGATRARYEFDGLAISGKVITGVTVYAFDGFGTSGTSGLAQGLDAADFVGFDGVDMVTLFIDELLTFFDRGGGESENFAEFRIDLLTRDVDPPPLPEPASAALALSGLAALAWSRRRSARRR